MKRSVTHTLIVAAVVGCALAAPARSVDEVVTIYSDVDLGPFPRTPIGFIHGLDEQGALDHDAVATLDPEHWRLYKWVTYDFASEHNASITYELANSYAWAHGGFPNARPWEDWAEWEAYVADRVLAVYQWFPDDPPAFFDIWNEPDHPYFWTGTYAQLLELFGRTVAVIEAVAPQARIVGPSISKYIPGGPGVSDIIRFLVDLDQQYDVRLDAVAWHENDSGVFGAGADRPEHIVEHAELIRDGLAANFPPDYQPELHVNEYGGGRVHLSPGYNVGYLYYLIAAGVDWASRACWTVYSGEAPPFDVWSDCWSGLDGMFMNDGTTPQVVYWVYKAVVDMASGRRLQTASSNPRTNVLAAHLAAAGEIRILVGRHYRYQSADLTIQVAHVPWPDATVRVEAARIPHFPEFFDEPYTKAIPFPDGPVDTWQASFPVEDGLVRIALDGFLDNDAWVLTVSRDSAVGVEPTPEGLPPLRLIGGIANPWPGSEEVIRFHVPERARIRLEAFDVAGHRVALLRDEHLEIGEHTVTWDARDDRRRPLAPGIYFLRLTDGRHTDTVRLVISRRSSSDR